MNKLSKVGILYFSPTGTTRQISVAISAGMSDPPPSDLNITLPSQRSNFIADSGSMLAGVDHLIVGAPVYTGKIPVQVIEILKTLPELNLKCTICVVYGNRDYGIALRQMAEILSERGYQVMGAGAFIGQHSYSDVIPVAIGRPDRTDLDLAAQFGMTSLQVHDPLLPEDMPVQLDMFSKSEKYTPLKPQFNPDHCSVCGDCAETCPTGIILADTGGYIHSKADVDCIGCMACVRSCASEARLTKPGFIMKHMIRYILRKAATQRLEPLTLFKKPPAPAA